MPELTEIPVRALATILACLTLLMVRPVASVAPFVSVQAGAKDLVSARGSDGRFDRSNFGEVSPFEVFDRTVWWRSSSWMVPLLIVASAMLVRYQLEGALKCRSGEGNSLITWSSLRSTAQGASSARADSVPHTMMPIQASARLESPASRRAY